MPDSIRWAAVKPPRHREGDTRDTPKLSHHTARDARSPHTACGLTIPKGARVPNPPPFGGGTPPPKGGALTYNPFFHIVFHGTHLARSTL